MQTYDTILEAFANGDLVKVLRGEGDYSVGVDQWVSADVPTDWTKVLPLFHEYANEIGIDKATSMLNKAIASLLKGNAEDIYIGMSVLYLQILIEEDHRSPIAINRDNLTLIAALRIRHKENELRKTKKWQGQNNPDGLWAEVERYRRLLKLQFGIVVPRLTRRHHFELPKNYITITVCEAAFHELRNDQLCMAKKAPDVRYVKDKSPSGKKILIAKYPGNKSEINRQPTKQASGTNKKISNPNNLHETVEYKRPSVRYTRKS